jgi:hypothetical protein
VAVPWKLLFKGGGVLTQAADALIYPDEAGYGSDVVRPVDEVVGDPGFLRLLTMTFTRTSPDAEDTAVCTFHLTKVVGEEFTNAWATGDYSAAEALFDTAWTTWKGKTNAHISLTQYRWYITGPARPKSGPPVRITSRSVVGGAGASNALPPQAAINVTERTRLRKHWGRFYLPLDSAVVATSSGRVAAGEVTSIHGAAVTLYNGLRSAGLFPVVYSRAKPERQTKEGVTLPPQPARAYGVESLATDDIYDVIRSRRYDKPVTKSTTTLT